FLLWRRMKLWELRSYEQVIKLEQDRLVYQARLHSRFGRAWRRKAPVESMTPLRLARYGVPLAETAPSGLAAAGIEPELLHPTTQLGSSLLPAASQPTPDSADTTAKSRIPETTPAARNTPTPARDQHPDHDDHKPSAQPEHVQYSGSRDNEPPRQPQHFRNSRPDASGPTGEPQQEAVNETDCTPWKDAPVEDAHEHEEQKQERVRDELPAVHAGLDEAAFTTTAPTRTTAKTHPPGQSPSASPSAAANTVSLPRHTQTPPTGPNIPAPHAQSTHSSPTHDQSKPSARTTPPQRSLTPVDRYYLAWHDLHQHLHTEPDATELSTYLAHKGIVDRDNQPLKPKTLARYLLQFRIYTIWAHHRAIDDQPAPDHVAKDLAQHGITAQYNQPIRPPDLERHHHTFEHRWQALNHHTHNNPPPQNTSQ
ncbi:hypothetical protein AB0O55_41965, partial [Streptomyces sp. NPDC091219]